jgi:predicted PurR-regulated permease PerM
MSENQNKNSHHHDVSRSLEVTIKVGLVIGLIYLCYLIIHPFLLLALWSVIIAVTVYPMHKSLGKAIKNHFKTSAILITALMLLILIVPIAILGTNMAEAVMWALKMAESKQPILPAPPPEVESWPIIGSTLFNLWQDAYQNMVGFAQAHSDQLVEGFKWLLKALTGAGFGLVLFLGSIIVSGLLLIFADKATPFIFILAERLMGKLGQKAVEDATATVKSVVKGILGIAFLQSVMAGLGFLVAGVPGAGLWAFLGFLLCIVQIGIGPVVIPVLIWVFFKMSLTTFILLAIWSAIILVIDNILKPILLGRKSPAPMVVVFLGAIGGFIYFGIIGLFAGAVILSLGYNLFLIWLHGEQSGSGEISINKA